MQNDRLSRGHHQTEPGKPKEKKTLETVRADAGLLLRIDTFSFGVYDYPAFAKSERRDWNPAQRPEKATIQRGFFMPIKNTGGIVPRVFCYGGLYRATPEKVGPFLCG